MQGFSAMLRAMGIDPAALQSQAQEFFKSVEQRFGRAEEDIASLHLRLERIERALGSTLEPAATPDAGYHPPESV